MPSGPGVSVMPPPGKPFEVFVADDQYCRSYASQAAGGNAQEAANTAAVGSAVVGTAVGAAAGALIGGGSRGAGVGAGGRQRRQSKCAMPASAPVEVP